MSTDHRHVEVAGRPPHTERRLSTPSCETLLECHCSDFVSRENRTDHQTGPREARMIHFHSVRGQSFNVRQQNVFWGMCMRAVGGRFPFMKNGQIAFHDAFSSSKPRPWNLPGLSVEEDLSEKSYDVTTPSCGRQEMHIACIYRGVPHLLKKVRCTVRIRCSCEK